MELFWNFFCCFFVPKKKTRFFTRRPKGWCLLLILRLWTSKSGIKETISIYIHPPKHIVPYRVEHRKNSTKFVDATKIVGKPILWENPTKNVVLVAKSGQHILKIFLVVDYIHLDLQLTGFASKTILPAYISRIVSKIVKINNFQFW